MNKYYAGIGSRETPKKICDILTQIATQLESEEYILRSGGANGADLAFEKGVDKLKEIFIPWKGFNNSNSNLFNIPDKAMEISAKFHPYWNNLKPTVKKLMARNAQQVLGKNLDSPSEFVICWTSDGCNSAKKRNILTTGGTGQAISIADANNIIIYNLANKADYDYCINRFLTKNKLKM